MKSLQEIAKELQKRLPSSCTVEVDNGNVTIVVYKKNFNLWCQVDFDTLNEVMIENGLIMWMRLEPIDNLNIPVFHIHRQ